MNSFKEYLESFGKSKSTVKHYNSYALDFLAWLDRDKTEVENASAKEVMSYMNHLQKSKLNGGREQCNQTRNTRLSVIKQFFNWQIEQGKRTDNPVAHLKIRGAKTSKLYPILSLQDLDGLYMNYEVPSMEDPRASRNWFAGYRLSKSRNKAIISLMVNQGMTTPEIEKLTTKDLKLKEGMLHIKGSRKSNERTLDLKSNQIIELMEYEYKTRKELLKYQAEKTGRLFLSMPRSGQSLAADSLQIWKGLSKEIKERHKNFINFKQVRTSVITHWLKQHNLRQVQYMAGHRYVSSTEKYLANHTEDLLADIDMYHPF